HGFIWKVCWRKTSTSKRKQRKRNPPSAIHKPPRRQETHFYAFTRPRSKVSKRRSRVRAQSWPRPNAKSVNPPPGTCVAHRVLKPSLGPMSWLTKSEGEGAQ
ncbi:unnamed protein product, partial [Ectocarpus sp. 6 AP-2014]